MGRQSVQGAWQIHTGAYWSEIVWVLSHSPVVDEGTLNPSALRYMSTTSSLNQFVFSGCERVRHKYNLQVG